MSQLTETLERPVAASTDPASTTARRWLGAFEDALAHGDAAGAARLFTDTSFWRDLVAVTWNLRTVEGPGGRRGHARIATRSTT